MKRGLSALVGSNGGGGEEESRASVRRRFMRRLNENFRAWVEKISRERQLSDWSAGVWDYVQAARTIDATLSPPTGRVYSFGSGDCGQLGHGVERGEADLCVGRPRAIDTLKDEEIESVVCGGLHNLAITAKGVVYSWGCSDDGVLGRKGDENYAAIVRCRDRRSLFR